MEREKTGKEKRKRMNKRIKVLFRNKGRKDQRVFHICLIAEKKNRQNTHRGFDRNKN